MNSRVQTIKIIDILIQSVLFVLFALSINLQTYLIPLLLALICFQLMSCIINLSLKHKKKKTMPRIASIVVGLAYLVLFFFFLKNGIKKVFLTDLTGEGSWKIPVTDIVIIATGVLLALVYFLICFRDVKSAMTKFKKRLSL